MGLCLPTSYSHPIPSYSHPVATKKKTSAAEPSLPLQEAKVSRQFVPLDAVLGQDAAIGILRAGMAAGRIHHAWIFHGPQGVGKCTTAIGFAAYLLDPTTAPDLSGQLAPDPESQIQHLLRSGSHPDLHVITKELAKVSRDAKIRDGKQIVIPKDVVEEFLIEPASRTRVVVGNSLAGKVFIVDEAELLDPRTQNSLLKTIEEPAPGTIVILVASNEDRLLPTVRSRCQRVRFGSLSDADMHTWLKRSGIALDESRQQWLVRFACGSPGAAASAIAHDLFKWHETLAPMLAELARGQFPMQLGAAMHSLVEEQAAAWVKANADASKEAANKAWSRRMLAFIAEQYRASLAAAKTEATQLEAALAAIDAVAQAEEELQANVSKEFIFENLAAKLGSASVGG